MDIKKVFVFTFLIKNQCMDSQSCNMPCVAWNTWMAFFEVCLKVKKGKKAK